MSSDGQVPEAHTVEDLVTVLRDTLRAFAKTGHSEDANRLAGRAYATLWRQYPRQAQRINGVMHAIARIPDTTGAPDPAGTSKPTKE